ncbi:MAG: histidine triad nucleotide-binding protein [Planctomycetota bacterium]
MAEKTLFEKIMDGDIPSTILHEDERCAAFADINPQAPVHVLIVPRKPLPGIADMTESDEALIGHLFIVANKIAKEKDLDRGYRLVINNGEHGQQSVPHLHLHLIGGRQLSWPPG